MMGRERGLGDERPWWTWWRCEPVRERSKPDVGWSSLADRLRWERWALGRWLCNEAGGW
jgi:hypothetical protein